MKKMIYQKTILKTTVGSVKSIASITMLNSLICSKPGFYLSVSQKADYENQQNPMTQIKLNLILGMQP